jgi:hypothetical protein
MLTFDVMILEHFACFYDLTALGSERNKFALQDGLGRLGQGLRAFDIPD